MRGSSERPTQPERVRGAAHDNMWQRLARLALFGGAVLVGLTLVLTFQFLPSRYDLNAGDVSVYTIKSPIKTTYISQILTREERQRAADAVPDTYILQSGVVDEQRRIAGDVLRQMSEVRRTTTTPEAKREAVRRIANLTLSPVAIDAVLELDEPAWGLVISETLRVLDRAMLNRIPEDQLDEIRATVPQLADPTLSDRQLTVVSELARQYIRPNYILDADATAKARREAADRVEPIRVPIERGETILRDGQIVRDIDLEKLQAAGLLNPTIRWIDILGVFLMVFAMVATFCLYLYYVRPSTLDHPGRLVLLAMLIILTPFAARLIVSGRDVNTIYAYLFPAAAASVTIAILLDTGVAAIATVVMAAAIGLISTSSFEIFLMTLVGGLAGIVGVRQLDRVSTLIRAGAFVSIANITTIIGFQLASGETETQRLVMIGVSGLTNGVLVGLVALGLMAFLGHLFGITTTISLLELAHPSQPLFRRLLSEAPGTYHHSVVVANLAERAAETIGADALLVRIGAYYHDIGKLVRPYAFIENQVDGQNIHDQLDPVTSANLIIRHVIDGLDMARREHLPQSIRDLIAQHHGTCLVKYFYHQACQGAEQEVDEVEFRYPGPKPQTCEAGIMMLADGVEAAVRASSDHSVEALRTTVDRIVQARLQEGQLDECDLTLRDLEQIRQAFVTVLQGIYHPRIEYPPPVAVERPTEVAKAP